MKATIMPRFLYNSFMATMVAVAAILVFAADTHLAAQEAKQADAGFEIPATDAGLPGAGPLRRYDWFRDLWKTKRSGWAQRVKQDQGEVVFLGDSITQGWGDDFGKSFDDLKVANRGISGDTTRGMLIRLEQDVLSLKPRAVVLLMGTNDLEEKAEPETIAANFKLIVAALKKHNAKMPIILCKVFPSSETKSRPAEKIKQINDLFAAAVKGDSQIVVMETWLLFADQEGRAKEKEFPDLLHPNEAGYKKWAAALRPVFATYGFLETEPDQFKNEPGFVSLFNGKDLSGWGFQATPDKQAVSFDGKSASDDGRFVAINGRLVVTTPPEGRRVQQLWTTREFPKDFILKLEFRATPFADSGVFIRAPQLQCRDYSLAGPFTELQKYAPQEWNELVVTVKGKVAHCTCNGEVLAEALEVPAAGGIGLEGDRGQMEYRRIRIKELP